MLRIIKSGFTSLGRERIKDEIKKRVAEGHKVLLIVPEQQTVMAEAEMADLLPFSAPLCFEVTNFTRLSDTASRALGGISGEYCDKTKKSLIMWRTLTELCPILSSCGSKAVNESMVSRYLAASEQLSVQGITEEALMLVLDCDGLTDTRLKSKLKDLATVFSLYKKLLSERYSDSMDAISAMPEKLKANPDYLEKSHIFIEGFTSFTAPQYSVISELSKRGCVSILINISHSSADSFEYTEVRDTIDRLKRAGRLADTDVRLENEYRSANYESPISLSGDLLWRQNGKLDKISLQNSDEIRIFEAETPFEECDFIASDIKRKVMAGESFSDFAIVARNAEKYIGILDTALDLAKIPAFFSKKKDIASHEAIKLIYAAYAVTRSAFSREAVIAYAKCALAGISREECDELEYYVEKWQINGSRFTDGEIWNMNPDGYTTVWKAGATERVAKINEIKQRLISPLLEFSEGQSRAKTVKEQAELLVSYLLCINLPEALEAEAKNLETIGEGAMADETRRIWPMLCGCLDTLVEVSGEMPSGGDAFIGQLKICLGQIDMAKIPSYVDEVTVGNADMLRLYGKKHIYLIGVNAGEFPGNVTDNAYFSEKDKETLFSLGLSVSPELETKGAKELYIFTRSYTYATESVTLTYSARNAKYKATERSGVIDRLTTIVEGLEVKKISKLCVSERIYSAEGALLALSSLSADDSEATEEALRKTGLGNMVERCHSSITNESLSLGRENFGDETRTISLTQSRIDSFRSCPFGYFCRYTLSLSPEEPAEFDARNIGTFIHAILENVFRHIRDKGIDTAVLSKEERANLTATAAEKYLAELGEGAEETSALTRIKISRLVRAASPIVDGLCDEFAVSGFKPKFFELAIAPNREDCPEPVKAKTPDGRDICVYGYIDRVDTYESGEDVFVRVVDYKTGAKKFSPEDISEGKNLQMFLYLKSILDSRNKSFKEKLGVKEGGRAIPAGVIYIKTAVGDTRVDTPDDTLAEVAVKSAQGREGMVLDNEESLSAMRLEYTPVPDKRKPDKISDSKRKFLFTEDSFEEIMNDAMDAVVRVADGITGGNIKAAPIEEKGGTRCESCEFKPICRSAVIK